MPRRPVLLVPGWSDRASVFRTLTHHLIDSGWPPEWVATVDFRDRYGSNIRHAEEIAEAIDGLIVQSPDAATDIVAHSMGGLAVRYFLQDSHHGRRIRRVVFLGTPHAGTWAAWFAWGEARAELKLRSPFLQSLRLPDSLCPELFSLYTPLDFRVSPASARMPGSHCISVPCAGHRRLLRSRAAMAQVAELLAK